MTMDGVTRRWIVWATVGSLVVAGGEVALLVTTSGAQPARQVRAAPKPPSPAVTATTTAAPPSADAGASVARQPKQVFTDFLVESGKALQQAKTDPTMLAKLASGFEKGEVEAHAAEFAERGWHQQGQPTVVWVHTVDSKPDAKPPTMTVEACIDSSDVKILDSNGKQVRGTADKPPRVPRLYTLAKSDSGWQVVSDSFPKAATC